MKKTKRYSGEDGISDVEDMKASANEGKGIFSGAAAPDESDTYAPKTRKFTTVSPDKPRPKVAKPAPKGSQSFPISVSTMESGADVMRRGQAGPSDSGKNAALESYKRDKKEREFNAARKSAAEERRNTARSTVASSPVTGAGFKKGGSVGSASKRADGIAQKGKTKGRML